MTLSFPLPAPLGDLSQEYVQAALERSFDVVRVEFSETELQVETRGQENEEDVKTVVSKLLYVARSLRAKRLYENNVETPYRDSPMGSLESSGDVIRIGNGLYTLQGDYLLVRDYLDYHVRSIALQYRAREQEYPLLWPVDLYKRIDYFKEFPQQVILATAVGDNFEERKNFAETYDRKQDYHSVDVSRHMRSAEYGLSAAVCDTCYYGLKQQRLDTNTVFTTCNKVFRNEYSATDSLDRLMQFTVRDIMYVGDQDFVVGMREKMIGELTSFLEYLEINARIETASDPFFTNDSIIKNVFQSSSELKYELLARLNYSERYIAVGSINLHLDFFGSAFEIELADGSPAFSGCIGVGFERLAYALYSQFGPMLEDWPAALREDILRFRAERDGS